MVGGESIEWVFVAASAAVGVWALGWRGWRAHGQRHPHAWFVLGLSLVVAGHRLEEEIGRPASTVVVAGAASIVATHVLNRKLLLAAGGCNAPCCAPVVAPALARGDAVAGSP